MRIPPQSNPVPVHEGNSYERLIQTLTAERDEAQSRADHNSDLLARERLLRDLLAAEIDDINAMAQRNVRLSWFQGD